MEAEVRPLVKELEREEKFPLDLLKKIADMGCCGMLMPEEWGGPGLDTGEEKPCPCQQKRNKATQGFDLGHGLSISTVERASQQLCHAA